MKPLSVVMAGSLRRMLKAEIALPAFVLAGTATRQGTRKALVARGLSDNGYTLNDRGRVLAKALGDVPTDPWGKRVTDTQWCGVCGDYVPLELFVHDFYDGAPDASEIPCATCWANQKGFP